MRRRRAPAGAVWLALFLGFAGQAGAGQGELTSAPAPAQAGAVRWQTLAPGFEAGSVVVVARGQGVEQILLARIDPAKFRFEVLNQPASSPALDEWMARLHAVAVVNGSYFTPSHTPDTPVVSDGVKLGPPDYAAHAGAFISSPAFTGIVDLRHADWRRVFSGARNALVSYPLLVADGAAGPTRPSARVAPRSFVGQDAAGRIILGTTVGAYFTLPALAAFLAHAPLGLVMALNLDGGPVACQAVALNGFDRRTYAQGGVSTGPAAPFGGCTLPIILAVFRR